MKICTKIDSIGNSFRFILIVNIVNFVYYGKTQMWPQAFMLRGVNTVFTSKDSGGFFTMGTPSFVT